MTASTSVLRLGLARNARAGTLLVEFVVAGVCTVLITRGLLALTGYPQIGGRGLHIAHVLPGGILMVVAILLLLSYVGPGARQIAAVVAGVGFGLFIDEVGKFVTTDNDYFFRPAPAIMYVAFVLIVLGVRRVHGRVLEAREQLANVVDQAVEGVAGGLTDDRRAAALEELERVGDEVTGKRQARDLIAQCAHDDLELPAVVERLRRRFLRGVDRVIAQRWFDKAVVAVLLLQVGAGLGLTAVPVLATEGVGSVSAWGVGAGSLLALAFVVHGLLPREHRVARVRSYQLAVLALLLVTRVFQFDIEQFRAIAGLFFDLLLLAVTSTELARLRTADAQAPKP